MNSNKSFQVFIFKVTREYHDFFSRLSLNTVNKNKIKDARVSFEIIYLSMGSAKALPMGSN